MKKKKPKPKKPCKTKTKQAPALRLSPEDLQWCTKMAQRIKKLMGE